MKKKIAILSVFLILFSVSAITVSAKSGDIFLSDGGTKENYVGEFKTEIIRPEYGNDYELTLNHPVYLTLGEDIDESSIRYESTYFPRPAYIVAFDSGWLSLRARGSSGKDITITPDSLDKVGAADKTYSYIVDESKDELKKEGKKEVLTIVKADMKDGEGVSALSTILRYNISVITKEEADEIKSKKENANPANNTNENMATMDEAESKHDDAESKHDDAGSITNTTNNDTGKNYTSSNNANGSIATGRNNEPYIFFALVLVLISITTVFIVQKHRKE